MEAYWQSVRQALEAQSYTPVGARRVEWAVRTALHPATRWDGLYMLAPSADELHAFSDSRDLMRARLSHQQLKALADAFVQAPTSDRTLPLMLALLHGYPSTAVDDTALSALERAMQEPDGLPYWTEQAMKLVAGRLGKPLKEEASTRSEDRKAFSARMKQQWEAFKKANQLKPSPL